MSQLPEKFIPYEGLVICTNAIQDARAVVESQGNPVLLVGKGDAMPLRGWPSTCPTCRAGAAHGHSERMQGQAS